MKKRDRKATHKVPSRCQQWFVDVEIKISGMGVPTSVTVEEVE